MDSIMSDLHVNVMACDFHLLTFGLFLWSFEGIYYVLVHKTQPWS